MFELPSKDANITPEKTRKSRQMQFCNKTAYAWSSLLMRSFAIDEPRSPARALYANLDALASFDFELSLSESVSQSDMLFQILR